MATTGLKIAYEITGNKQVEALYNQWVEKLRYRAYKDSDQSFMGEERVNYDDTDHLLPDLYLLNLLEKDEELLAFYRKCVKDSWEVHKKDKMAWFNYIYQAVLGDAYGDEAGSLWNLQTFPTNRILQPQMNSIRTDIEFHTEGEVIQALHPLPVYERPSDNEYEWKRSPYKLDGWHSRIVKKIEISPYDDYVQFAIEANGNIYRSLTRGETWQHIEALSGVRDLIMFPAHRWLVVAGTEQGVYRSFNCGDTWEKAADLPVDRFFQNDTSSTEIYAVSSNGIFFSGDFGEWGAGEAWQKIDGNTPDLPYRNFAVETSGEEVTLYMQTCSGLYFKREKEPDWTAPVPAVRGRGFSELMTFPGKPIWTKSHGDRVFSGIYIDEWAYQGTISVVSEDHGRSWTPIVKDLDPLYRWMVHARDSESRPTEDLMRMLYQLKRLSISDLVFDKSSRDTWYGRVENGVAITHDAGKTWDIGNVGLHIPVVKSIFCPRYGDGIYIGTPAGMYVSRDQGQSWEDTSLILQDVGALRAEIGGAGYLEAYWLGRYHGFIDEEEANKAWWP
jgi:photosystem II stability/assembly factor-like uncharacterized protein